MASEIQNLIAKLDAYFKKGAEADSGKSARAWFDEADFEDLLKEALETADNVALESYQLSKSDEKLEPSIAQIKKRQELTFIQALLAGYRTRYVAGNDSDPRSELDSRRYSMYSSEARRVVLRELKDFLL